MKVQVEEISTVEKKITVEMPWDAVDRALNTQYKQLGKKVRVKGFRPGKVPKSLVKRMFRSDAENGASSDLIQSAIMDAFKEAEVEPLGVPDIERDPISEGEPFTFSMFCQVRPDFSVHGVDGLSVAPKQVEPDDESIQAELQRLREQAAEAEPVEDRGADIGDILTIDFVGTLDGDDEPFEGGTGTDHELELGTGSLIPGFEDQLVGATPEEQRDVKLSFPDDYGPEHLNGRAATFAVTVKEVKRKVLPDIDDDMAVDLEFDDLSALRADVYDRLSEKLRQDEDGRVREEVLKHLMEANPIEIPQTLIDQSAERLKRQLGMHLAMSGMPRENLEAALSMQGDTITTRAKELAHRDLLLDGVAREQELEVSDEALDERVGEMAEQTGQPKPKVRAMLADSDRLEGLRQEMLYEKAMSWLEEKAMMGQATAEAPAAEPAEAPAEPAEAPAEAQKEEPSE